jgi:DNA polymerase I-like protein with 3'-5' exonuclease and polymerase domains
MLFLLKNPLRIRNHANKRTQHKTAGHGNDDGDSIFEQWVERHCPQTICETHNEDLDWLRKQVEMMEDMITDTWFYQHILNRGRDEGRAEGRDEGLEALQQAVISIIQAHFPELTQQAQKVVSQVTDFQQLQQLNLDLYIARDAAEVTQLLSALANYADS